MLPFDFHCPTRIVFGSGKVEELGPIISALGAKRVLVVSDASAEEHRAVEADALVTDRPGVALGVVCADCAPVLIADPEAGVIGCSHAGWRGALAGVIEATVSGSR